MANIRFVLFFKRDHENVSFSFRDRSDGVEDKPIIEEVLELLGGMPDGAETTIEKESKVVLMSSGTSLVEVWEKPESFDETMYDGKVFGGNKYTKLATIEDVVAIRTAQHDAALLRPKQTMEAAVPPS